MFSYGIGKIGIKIARETVEPRESQNDFLFLFRPGIYKLSEKFFFLSV